MTRVTVIIPTYNRAALLRRALRSVLDQTLTDFECIVSDNASTDDTASVVASCGDSRVTHSPLPANIGPKANFTRGLRLGTAPYVTLLQDDDLMAPRNLERKVALLDTDPEMMLAHSAFRYIDGDDHVVKEWGTWCRLREDAVESGDEFIRRSIDTACRVDFSAAVMRRTAVRDEEFREADGPPCDMALWMRIARRGRIGYLAEPLVSVRVHPSATTTDGTYDIVDSLYRPAYKGVALVQHVKHTFLDEFGREFPDERVLRARARTSGRRALLGVVRNRTEPAFRPLDVARGLWEAARVDPGVLVTPATAKLVAGSLLGERARTALAQVGHTRGNAEP
jgi:glycosyltransferase involved in cell wall biosynthesis